ncbi:metal ABC transporter substrate-binding protein [Eubacteriales bacterium OttesenSCG-928-N13]|nr:metal ABC transporter substrate-binding protein [Eubacteriales bacterium OttesenSCG-928-N13]
MRKFFSVLLVIMMLLGCGVANAENGERLQIVATSFAAYDFAREIAGELADVELLVKPGMDSHSYEPTPQDMVGVQQADLLLTIGGENEAWVTRMLSSIDTSNLRMVRLIEHVATLEQLEMEEDEHAHDEHEDHGIDEHIWTSPRNAMDMCCTIADALCEIDPGNGDIYQENLNRYLEQLSQLDAEFAQLVAGAARKELVFGDRFPFVYFTHEYGLTAYAAFPSCSNDTEPSALTIKQLIERVKQDQIPVIYTIEQSNQRVAKTIAESTGAKILTLHSCHNLSLNEFESGASYLSLMKTNIQALREGLY